MSKFTEDDYIKCFEENYENDGDLELDRSNRENVSIGDDDGAYVLCWKWIDNADLE